MIFDAIKKRLGLDKKPVPARRAVAKAAPPVTEPIDAWRRPWWLSDDDELLERYLNGGRDAIIADGFAAAVRQYKGDSLALAMQIVSAGIIDRTLREDALSEGRARLARLVGDIDEYAEIRYGEWWPAPLVAMLLEAEAVRAGLPRAKSLQKERREAAERTRIKEAAMRPGQRLEMGGGGSESE